METRELWVLDGGMGRELARRGAPFRQPEWSALALMEGSRIDWTLEEPRFRAVYAGILRANRLQDRARRAVAGLHQGLLREAELELAGELPPAPLDSIRPAGSGDPQQE